MERQETPQDLSSREITQRKIKDVLDYLGDNYNIIDKSVREGDATNMDIARSFTADTKSDKLVENIGLLDFTPLGTYFAFEEGQKEIMKEEPDAFKRQMALLGSINKPLQSIIDRPEITVPATEMALSMFEALPVTYVITKPLRKFLTSLKKKAQSKKDNQEMIEKETSRLDRAEELGFNIDAYHGTRQEVAINPIFTKDGRRILVEDEGAPIKEFLDKSDYEGDTPSIQDVGTYFSQDPDVASYFAGDGNYPSAQVYPVKLKLENPKEYFTYEEYEEDFENFMSDNLKSGKSFVTDDIGSKAFREKLQSEGHDGILISRSTTDTGSPRQDYVVFEPKNIRSQFAKFDKDKINSRDILAGAGFTALGTLGALPEEELPQT